MHSVLGLLLSQGAEWKFELNISIKSGKYGLKITNFVQPSFSIRQNTLNIEHKWHQSRHIFHIVYMSSVYQQFKDENWRTPHKLWLHHQSPPRRVENSHPIWGKRVEYYCRQGVVSHPNVPILGHCLCMSFCKRCQHGIIHIWHPPRTKPTQHTYHFLKAKANVCTYTFAKAVGIYTSRLYQHKPGQKPCTCWTVCLYYAIDRNNNKSLC